MIALVEEKVAVADCARRTSLLDHVLHVRQMLVTPEVRVPLVLIAYLDIAEYVSVRPPAVRVTQDVLVFIDRAFFGVVILQGLPKFFAAWQVLCGSFGPRVLIVEVVERDKHSELVLSYLDVHPALHVVPQVRESVEHGLVAQHGVKRQVKTAAQRAPHGILAAAPAILAGTNGPSCRCCKRSHRIGSLAVSSTEPFGTQQRRGLVVGG